MANADVHAPEFKASSLTIGTLIVSAGFIIGKATGFFREMVIAYEFGASEQTDAYLIAFIVPILLHNLVAGGALDMAFMPVFARYLVQDRLDEAWRLMSTLLNLILMILTPLTVLGIIFAPFMASVLGYGLEPETKVLAGKLLNVTMVVLVLNGALSLFIAILNSLHFFWSVSLLSTILNVTIISFTIILGPQIGILATALGFAVGSGIQVAVQLPALRRLRVKYYPVLSLKHPGIRMVRTLFFPCIIGSAVSQVNVLVDRVMASPLPPGSIAALNFADSIIGFFNSFGMAFAIVAFPTLNELAAGRNYPSMVEMLSVVFRLSAFLLVPVAILLIVMPQPIVATFYQRGSFDAGATKATAQALTFFALGLPWALSSSLLFRTFYALSDAITPLKAGLAMILLKVLLNWLLRGPLGHGGIALSTSLVYASSVLGLMAVLRVRLGHLDSRRILGSGARILLSALGMGGTALGLREAMSKISNFNALTSVALTVTIAFLSYIGWTALLKVKELSLLLNLIARKRSRFEVDGDKRG